MLASVSVFRQTRYWWSLSLWHGTKVITEGNYQRKNKFPWGDFTLACGLHSHRIAQRPRAEQGSWQLESACPCPGHCTGSERGNPSKCTLWGSPTLAVVLHFLPRHIAIVLLTFTLVNPSRKPWHCGGWPSNHLPVTAGAFWLPCCGEAHGDILARGTSAEQLPPRRLNLLAMS